MKRFRMWLRELNLTQQLMSILFLVIFTLTVFIFTFLSPTINQFTWNEMYRTLHVSQTTLVTYLNQNPDTLPPRAKESEGDILSAIYDPDQGSFYYLSPEEFTEAEQTSILANLPSLSDTRGDYMFSETGKRSQQVLYTITKLTDGRYMISLMPSSYELEFRSLLVNNIVNLNMLVALTLFILLTIWIASLIYPLNQIRTYITKIKNDEPAVLTVNRRDEIGEVADALREMQAELQKQNEEKQEMIQNISHDLKTPIATIKSYGESIKDGIYPYGTLEKSVDVIIENADRLEKKVRSLIALNKMGYLLDDCPEGDTLDMNEVIDKVLLGLKVIRPEISFETDLDKGVLFHGDEDPWRIVVENLVDNALRYARTTIRIELHPGELSVINDGSQISEDRMGKLFKAYEKGTDGQFGLGLSIVYKVCSTYGYHIEAENLADGVKFHIWKELPAKTRKALEKEKKQEAREKARSSRKAK